MTDRPWVFRADASSSIGIGHVMRSLTLAGAAVASGHRCEFHSVSPHATLVSRAEQLGVNVVEVPQGAGCEADATELAAARPAVVVFGADFTGALTTDQRTIIVIDDNREADVTRADVVLNVNPHARVDMYRDCPGDLLLGLRFALVRNEISALRTTPEPRPDPDQIVVSLGGADVAGVAIELCRGLLDGITQQIGVVVGPANPRATAVRRLIAQHAGRLHEIPHGEFATALTRADLALLAGGGTLWEAATLGVPVVALVSADNQARPTSTDEVRSFASVHDIRHQISVEAIVQETADLLGDTERRLAMAASGHSLVDGRGAARVIDHIEGHLGERHV
jgi:UDP-2,4-diacetamido-2,4,6-trideoxy-beta-L-altropyranose hydrolase